MLFLLQNEKEIDSETQSQMSRYADQLNEDDALFASWMNKVEDIVLEETCIGLLDCPDEDFRGNFEGGWTPKQMGLLVVFNVYRWLEGVI